MKSFWGPTGHRVVGQIAENYLSVKAKKAIDKLLDGHGLAFVSTYADDIKADKRYDKYYSWHYINMPMDQDYQESEKNPDGDLVTGITKCMEVIKDPKTSKEDKAFYLKLLVHFIGDLHQPMHIGLAEDRGGNDFKVQWFYNDSNLHRVWDSEMIENYKMSYSELAANADILSAQQIRDIQKGTVVDWVNEVHQLTRNVYDHVKEGENLRYRYAYDNFGTVRTQLQKAGVRLAKVLNDLFS
ncbi:S1/P1 nuclease [Gaetbulibacter aestuarii]